MSLKDKDNRIKKKNPEILKNVHKLEETHILKHLVKQLKKINIRNNQEKKH